MITDHPDELKTNYAGFQAIIRLFDKIDSLAGSDSTLHLGDYKWIDANMCAPLGAVMAKARERRLPITINAVPGTKTVMRKNGFSQLFDESSMPDSYHTTIPYRHFSTNDKGFGDFKDYVTAFFSPGSKGLPQMTPLLLKRFRKSLFEIFCNAMDHAELD